MKNYIRWIVLFITLLVLPMRSSVATHGISVHAEWSFTTFLPCLMKACQNQIPIQPSPKVAVEAETLGQINVQRAANGGLAPLTMRDSLVQIARFHSIDMATHNLTSHFGSAGEGPWTRYGWVCDEFGMEGEIIGWGFGGNIGRMIDWWMNSPGHHDAILTPEFTLAGVGYAEGGQWGSYWTVDFASPPFPASGNVLATHNPTCSTETTASTEGGISVTVCK